jgi:caffeoyl-CoA O-methyltransferase
MSRLVPGGVILVDNTLRHGAVADPLDTNEGTLLMREFNDLVIADKRVTTIMVPLADGLTLIRKN